MSRFKANSLYYTDGYKIGHKKMLADGTTKLYGTWIPRSIKYAPPAIKMITSFGQQLTVKWLRDEWEENFFGVPVSEAVEFGEDMAKYLGMPYDASHFVALHNLGYLPIKIKRLPEGIETNPNIPHMTFINTVDGFAWLTLYLETIISSLAWKPSTSATIARQYKRNATEWVTKTDPNNLFLVDYMCHDFSARGLSPWDMISSGLGHSISFRGSDTLIVIPASRYFYNLPKGDVCINSVIASEHSVSTTKIFTVGEEKMISDWIDDFNDGILSLVLDTMDLTKVVKPINGGYIYNLKNKILNKNGKVVVRPDSSPSGLTPVDMICGHSNILSARELEADYPEFYHKGLIECLWDIFGGTINEQGYKVLDPHIGGIYGDAITLQNQVEIYSRLADKGFASTNIVLGVGSYTYQMNTRDTLGFAAKGGWFEANGIAYNIHKDPLTDDGTKKSPKGLLKVYNSRPECSENELLYDGNDNIVLKDQCTKEEENTGLLETIFLDGKLVKETSLSEIRDLINK